MAEIKSRTAEDVIKDMEYIQGEVLSAYSKVVWARRVTDKRMDIHNKLVKDYEILQDELIKLEEAERNDRRTNKRGTYLLSRK